MFYSFSNLFVLCTCLLTDTHRTRGFRVHVQPLCNTRSRQFCSCFLWFPRFSLAELCLLGGFVGFAWDVFVFLDFIVFFCRNSLRFGFFQKGFAFAPESPSWAQSFQDVCVFGIGFRGQCRK